MQRHRGRGSVCTCPSKHCKRCYVTQLLTDASKQAADTPTHLEHCINCGGSHPVGGQRIQQPRQQHPSVGQAMRVAGVVGLQPGQWETVV